MREPADDRGANSWGEYRRLVLKSLEDLHQLAETRAREGKEALDEAIDEVKALVKEIDERQRADRESIVALKVKSALIGSLAGAIVGAIISTVVALLIK